MPAEESLEVTLSAERRGELEVRTQQETQEDLADFSSGAGIFVNLLDRLKYVHMNFNYRIMEYEN